MLFTLRHLVSMGANRNHPARTLCYLYDDRSKLYAALTLDRLRIARFFANQSVEKHRVLEGLSRHEWRFSCPHLVIDVGQLTVLTTNIEIEVRHLRYVVTAAEQGSFRKASTKLGVRESTISRQIRDLEDALGSSLFIRRPSGVLLTQAGESFVERAQCALTQIEYAICDVGAIGRGGHGVIRIGLLSSLATGFVANLIERYSKHHKEVQLEFLEADHGELIPAIRRHQLDMAFITEPLEIEDFSSIRLWTEQVYVILSKHDLLASRSEIVWDDIRQRRFVVTEVAPGREVEALLVRNLSSLGYRPHILRDRVSRQTLMQLVACGRGITLAGESVIEAQFPGVVYRPLSGCSLPFCGIWSDENDNPAFRRLLSVANTLSKARGGLARSDSRTS